MTSLPLLELPAEVTAQILSFLSSPRALCRVATTCSILLEAINASESLWDGLYQQRWQRDGPCVSRGGGRYLRQDYRDRHLRDRAFLHEFLRLSEAVAREQDYALGRKYENPLWVEMRQDGYNMFALFRAIANNEAELRTHYNVQIPAVARSVAAQLMDEVNFLGIIMSWHSLMSIVNDEKANDNVLEEGAFLVAESMWTWKELLANDPNDRIRDAKKAMTELGHHLEQRINDRGGVGKVSTLDAINLLKVLLEENGVSVTVESEEYTIVVNNPSLEDFLQYEKGMHTHTLAVLYACVLRRVGVPVDITQLPNIFLVKVPSSETYVDVVRAGSIWSREECEAMGRRLYYEDEWTPRPLDYRDIFLRLTGFCMTCQTTVMARCSATTGLYHALEKARALISVVGSRWTEEALEHVTDFHEFRPYLDPEIYRHFELINGETMARYMQAPYDEQLLYIIAQL